MIDFSGASLSPYSYDGADRKQAIIFEDRHYMLKLQRKLRDMKNILQADYSFGPISEHLGCEIFKSCGIAAQNTILGLYDGKLAVACEDFILNDIQKTEKGWGLYEFSAAEKGMFDGVDIGRFPSLDSIYYIFDNHQLLNRIKDEGIARYWDTFVIDALIGNSDRHCGNWGYIARAGSDELELAPVYDCGASLYPRIDDTVLAGLMASAEEVDKRLFDFPNPAISIGGCRAKFCECLLDTENRHLQEALLRVVPRIDMGRIDGIVGGTEGISPERREFLRFMLQRRFEALIEPAYRKAQTLA